MSSNISIDLKKVPFQFARPTISGIMFVVGDRWTKIRIAGCPIDAEGNAIFQTTPEQAREIAKDLLDHADKDQKKLILKRS
jgi:hypothetical protein